MLVATQSQAWPQYKLRPTPEDQRERFHEALQEIAARELVPRRSGRFVILKPRARR